MKIIKNTNNNNKMPEISLETQQLRAEKEEASRAIRLEREYARRSEQSAADRQKNSQKAALAKPVVPAPVETVKNEELAPVPELVQTPKPKPAVKSAQKKDEPSISEQNEHSARAIRQERELERRAEQSQQDKARARAIAKQHGLFSAPKPQAKQSNLNDLPLILDQRQREKAIKELREMERREEQSRVDRARRKK